MSNKIILKKSSVAAKVPLVTDLEYGELALNYADGKLYYKTASNEITSLIGDTLGVDKGGTGLTSVTANRLLYGNGTSALQTSANLTFDGTTLTNTGNAIISDNSANAALRITQVGAGNALLVEDSANPDATPFVVTATGAVGIGTSSPQSIFDVASDAQPTILYRTISGGAIVSFNRATGSVSLPTVVVNGLTLGAMQFRGYDGTAYRVAAQLDAVVDGVPGANDMPGRFVFSTTADGASAPTERMRIASTGIITLGAGVGAESLRVTPVASSVNYLNIQGATTTNDPSITAAGTDANIDVQIVPKGTGGLRFAGPLLANNLAGTAGQVLTSAGAGAAPTWTTPSIPVIGTVATATTITPTSASGQYNVTALASAATIAAPSGTPSDGQTLMIRIIDNGTARALTWTTTSGAYRAVGVTLPTTTVVSKTHYIDCVYNSQALFWDVINVK